MNWRKASTILLVFVLCLFSFRTILAKDNPACDNRYLTLINPVRGRNLWLDNSIKPLVDQYEIITDYNYSATWLLQYDALTDQEIVGLLKDRLSEKQEIGLFLEISPDLTQSARILYPPMTPWYKPQAVFLSGYSQSERRKLVDTVFVKYKEVFGSYPVSVGVWWVDSYSLEYMKNKYGIRTVLIVADQKTTDNYGVWGQWWGVPYYPSLANVLIPASDDNSKLDVVALQWAQRDISKANGEGTNFSNYSLQANDYTERGLDTAYFEQLAGSYLDCGLPIGQITVGLETGIESVKAFPEYIKQLEALSKINNLHSVTMNEFSRLYREKYPRNPEKIVLKDGVSEWVMTIQGRENKYHSEGNAYQNDLAFNDYFVADKTEFLDRKLPIHRTKNFPASPFLVIPTFVLGFILYSYYHLTGYFGYISLFILATYLTTFLDYTKYGRSVYFGPYLGNITVSQFFLTVVSFVLFIPILKFFVKRIRNIKLLLLILPLTYAVDFIAGVLRYTRLHGEHYLGFAWDPLRFIGLRFSQKSLALINQDFPSIIAGALLRFDFNIIWDDTLIALVAYPLAHLVLGVVIYFILNKSPKIVRYLSLTILFILFCLYIYNTLNLNPRFVV